jgi:hypothetical protein
LCHFPAIATGDFGLLQLIHINSTPQPFDSCKKMASGANWDIERAIKTRHEA